MVRSLALLSALLLSFAAPPAHAAPALADALTLTESSKPAFIRTRKEANEYTSLDIAITRYEGAVEGRPVTVDLVGAVHIGSAAYYEELNRRFVDYDAVLYELVAPPHDSADINKPGRSSGNPLSALQTGMGRMVGMDFQLEKVNYGAKNFVHADLSPELLYKAMTKRGESISSLMLRLMAASMKDTWTNLFDEEQLALSRLPVLEILLRGPTPYEQMVIRRALAKSFNDVERVLAGFDGPNGSSIIADRNEAAVNVMLKEARRGKRTLAIFYGAAHMPDFDTKLKALAFKPVAQEWLEGWDLRDPRKR